MTQKQQFEWVNKSEVAVMLEKSRPTVDRWIATGKLPSPVVRLGMQLFRRNEIEKIKAELGL